jgi:hypothetical protein
MRSIAEDARMRGSRHWSMTTRDHQGTVVKSVIALTRQTGGFHFAPDSVANRTDRLDQYCIDLLTKNIFVVYAGLAI